MNPYLRHIHACNLPVTEPFLEWQLNGVAVGWLRPRFAAELARCGDIFRRVGERIVCEIPGDFTAISAVLAEVVAELSTRGVIPLVLGEPYPVTADTRSAALCVVDRGAAAYLGIRSFGQHLNAVVRGDGDISMWIARRARDRMVFPGALDHMVAGGLPWGISLQDNLLKECAEEADVPPALARQAVAVGAVTYNRVAKRGFRPDVLYCYDLFLPADFEPRNTDGEVESFRLLPVTEVMRIVRESDEFKLNCNLVLIDFFVRHGLIAPDEPDYLALVSGLRPSLGLQRD